MTERPSPTRPSAGQPARRPDPVFVGGHVALDLLNSIASPSGTPIEWLRDGDDLLAWLLAAGLMDEGVARKFRNGRHRKALDRAAAEARNLREWFRAFAKAYAGAPLPQESLRELARLNAILAKDHACRRVALADPQRLTLEGERARRFQMTLAREL